MPEINGDTIPGSVALPTWVLIAAVVGQAGAMIYLVRKLIELIPLVTAAISLSTKTVEDNTEVLRSLEK
jgi:hypothetical protein